MAFKHAGVAGANGSVAGVAGASGSVAGVAGANSNALAPTLHQTKQY